MLRSNFLTKIVKDNIPNCFRESHAVVTTSDGVFAIGGKNNPTEERFVFYNFVFLTSKQNTLKI